MSFWTSYSFSGVSCPNVDFETSVVTFFITFNSCCGSPIAKNLELIAYWEDSYDAGEFVKGMISCCWSNNCQKIWKSKNTYRGEVDRLGIDIPWHFLSRMIH